MNWSIFDISSILKVLKYLHLKIHYYLHMSSSSDHPIYSSDIYLQTTKPWLDWFSLVIWPDHLYASDALFLPFKPIFDATCHLHILMHTNTHIYWANKPVKGHIALQMWVKAWPGHHSYTLMHRYDPLSTQLHRLRMYSSVIYPYLIG